jgi:AraC-like DNA-binding protein
VAARLASGEAGDLLAIAHDEGFGSKASFNRAFRARYGITPSEYRRHQVGSKASTETSAGLKS